MTTWDRSHDYVVYRTLHELLRVTVRFQSSPPAVAELIALRRCLPEFRELALAVLREKVGDSQELSLDELPAREARTIVESLQAGGLEVTSESSSFVSYLPYDRTTRCGWPIKDDAEAAAVAQEMIAAGVPVEDIRA